MEEAPPIDSPVAAVGEPGSPQIDARDHLVTECLRAFHESQPRMPRASSLNGFLRQPVDELNTFLSTSSSAARRRLLRALLTVYLPPLSEKAMSLADELLLCERTPTPVDALALPRIAPKVAIWRGDITMLKIDAIVNAANSQMLGCFTPEHKCIDNVIHGRAGPRLRAECRDIMKGTEEPTGSCRVTRGYCLHAKHVLHTVGPIIGADDELKPIDLASSYRSCLDASVAAGIRSVAFCCISTGVFGYPQEPAARVALATVREWLAQPQASAMDLVLFDVFLPTDAEIYARLAPEYFPPNPAPAATSASAAPVNP